MPTGVSPVESFLKAKENTVTRERLLFHRFCFDMYLAAARCGYPMAVLSIEVDREGFDVVLDDGDRERRIQLKVVDGTTASWHTTKRFLRPEAFLAEALGFKQDIEGVGVGGAFVVMRYEVTGDDFTTRYLFFDAHILAVRLHEWVPGKAKSGKGRKGGCKGIAKDLMSRLNCGVGSEKVTVPKGLFVLAAGPSELLALLEMNSLADHQWCQQLRLRLSKEYDHATHGPVEKEIEKSLEELIDTNG